MEMAEKALGRLRHLVDELEFVVERLGRFLEALLNLPMEVNIELEQSALNLRQALFGLAETLLVQPPHHLGAHPELLHEGALVFRDLPVRLPFGPVAFRQGALVFRHVAFSGRRLAYPLGLLPPSLRPLSVVFLRHGPLRASPGAARPSVGEHTRAPVPPRGEHNKKKEGRARSSGVVAKDRRLASGGPVAAVVQPLPQCGSTLTTREATPQCATCGFRESAD
jgi:hypothetical protein